MRTGARISVKTKATGNNISCLLDYLVQKGLKKREIERAAPPRVDNREGAYDLGPYREHMNDSIYSSLLSMVVRISH